MASRWNGGWFDVAPRYSAGSPAMVDMATALSVARDEARMFAPSKDWFRGPELEAVARLLGLRGIVEWKVEAGVRALLAYDLLTHTWHQYGSLETTGVYECTRAGFPSLVVVARLGRGNAFRVVDQINKVGLLNLYAAKEQEVRDWLARGRYRKAAPERAQHVHRHVQQAIDEALEDAGVKAR